MTQQQSQAGGPATRPGTSSASFGCFLRGCSWGWGILALIIGGMRVGATPLHGAVMILLGVLLLPPIRTMIGRSFGIRLAAPAAIALAMMIMAMMVVIGRDIYGEQMIEKRKREAIEKERRRQENAFIARYPYVDRDSLRAWKESAADSTVDPGLTLGGFLRRQEDLHARHLADSIAQAAQQRKDSIARAKQWREDSIASAKSRRSDSIAAAREAQRADAE